MSVFRRARMNQIRVLRAPNQAVERTSFVRHPRARPGISYRATRVKCGVGYQRPCATFANAAAAMAGHEGGGANRP